jgi:hypothetical protein
MKTRGFLAVLAACFVLGDRQASPWTREFPVEKSALGPRGRSAYFILEPGYVQVLEAGRERLVITVLNETRSVDGVETRIVEERETDNGTLVEVSRNYFAIDSRSGDVYYFGEAVDLYRNGRLSGHEGAWLAGEDGARFGLMLPGRATLGAGYYQELAPGRAMDRGRIVALRASVVTPAGRFRDCVKVEETTPLEPGVREYKYYAPGVGLVQDGTLKLVRSGPAPR